MGGSVTALHVLLLYENVEAFTLRVGVIVFFYMFQISLER